MIAASRDVQDVLGRVRSRLPRHRLLWLGASAAALTATLVLPFVRADRGLHSEAAAQVMVVALVLALLGRGLVALGLSRAVAMTYMLGAAARFAYLTVTPWSARTHDAEHHIEYVEYLLAHHAIPPPSAGWSFYHPPLYFVLAALLWRTLTALGVSARPILLEALQVQSLAYHLGYLAFALLTGKRWLDALPAARVGPDPTVRARLGILFAALLCLWPSGVLHSVRVGNDDLFYLWFGGFLLFVTRWWLDGRRRDFHLAAVFAALSMLTKSNGLIAFAVLGVLWGVHVARDPARSIRSAVKLAWPAVVLFALPTGLTLLRAIRGDAGSQHPHLLVGNAESLNPQLAVGNGAANYLWFDLKMLVTQPFSSSFTDDAGRQYFANFMIKTSLLGDFQFDGATLSNLAIVMSFLVLPILACIAVAVAYPFREDWLVALPLPLTVAVSVASLAALRMSIPKACSNDFRYILPVIVPALCLYVRGLVRLRELGRPAWARVGETAGWAFVATTLAFFAVLARWP
jgi:hypothetical protein